MTCNRINILSKAYEYANGVAKDIERIFENGVYCGVACTLSEYLENQLEVEYITDFKENCNGAIFLITYGGPSCYLVQHHGSARIECYWGVEDPAVYHLSGEIARAIRDTLPSSIGVA